MQTLFSQTTDEVLSLFLNYPNTQFYANQIVQLTNKYPNSISQSLKRLINKKLIKAKKVGKYTFYSLDKTNPMLVDISEIMLKMGKIKKPSWLQPIKDLLANSQPGRFIFDRQKVKFKGQNFVVSLDKINQSQDGCIQANIIIKHIDI